MNDTQLRKALETALCRSVSDDVWDRLDEDGLLDEAKDQTISVRALAKKARDLEAYLGIEDDLIDKEPGRRPRSADAALTRDLAISDMIAAVARDHPLVVQYRKTHLRNGLMAAEEIFGWVERRTGTGGAPPAKASESDLVLWLPTADVSGATAVTVASGTRSLWDLARVSQTLSKMYPWTEAQSTMFVLSGEVPMVESIRISYSHVFPMAVRSRITMSIDPAATPREVMDRYAAARRRVLGPGRKPKMPTEKTMRLAVFTAQHESADLEVMRRDWNAANPDQKYPDSQAGNFKRDVHRAQRRLLEPDYQ